MISGGTGCVMQHAVDAVANFNARRLATRCARRSPAIRSLPVRISFTSRTTDASWAIFGEFGTVGLDLARAVRRLSSFGCAIKPFDRFAADAEVRFDQLGDLSARWRGPVRIERPVAGTELVERIEIERIARGDDQLPL
ncbi:MAG: hypothetical protein QM811_28780 [Pirellulales bacterium]